ncbi:MAG: acyl carrier protein [Planctomycetaceae bacterium]|nr:acyl carrier protein [Planctomycetales bacterium]MCA9171038.1 acyl carrier protein [Planctomycetales bacterium]MCB9872852.1 acyl carrier protein [Planctomycetaceae bacterium]MCB9941399.1 acyl carrier protein [Planctomycetaceae bacterium]HRX81285.1 acyl carrier protein [Pirellulaceae bacterium]
MTNVEEIIQLMKDAGIARGKADALEPERSLDEQGLDSYDRMSLLNEVEEHFNVQLPNEIANKLKTLNDVVRHLNADN